jgi:hypothetical protein
VKQILATLAALCFLVSCATPWKPGDGPGEITIPPAVEQAIAEWIEANTPKPPPAVTNAPPVVVNPPAVTNAPPVTVTPPVAPPNPPPVAQPGRPTYEQARKKTLTYKTRHDAKPVTRWDAALLIPEDRPPVRGATIPGQAVKEAYFAPSEQRWILRTAGAMPDTPATIAVHYEGGQSEVFKLDSLRRRTERPAGPFKPVTVPK